MDRAKARVLVSILKDSSLYETMPHEEKISLLSQLERDYPSLLEPLENKEEGKETAADSPETL